MTSVFRYSDRTIFVLGMHRSGTSWIGKVFDSHPDVIYRHEPDVSFRNEEFPYLLSPGDAETYCEAVADWLNALALVRDTRSAGKLPVFRKRYHTVGQHLVRQAMIAGLKAGSRVPGLSKLLQRVSVPDFIPLDSGAYRKLVIKSASSMGRAAVLAKAAPDSRFIVLLRHPCGQIASMLRGVRWSLFEEDLPLLAVADTPLARGYGLTVDRLRSQPLATQLAWNWVIHNEMAIEALAGAQNVKIVRYIELARDPMGEIRKLFEFCGLDWPDETQRYLAHSIIPPRVEGYYQLRRDPMQAATKWKTELSAVDIANIMTVAERTVPGQYFSGAASARTGVASAAN